MIGRPEGGAIGESAAPLPTGLPDDDLVGGDGQSAGFEIGATLPSSLSYAPRISPSTLFAMVTKVKCRCPALASAVFPELIGGVSAGPGPSRHSGAYVPIRK
jgi:hypothetical protein